jgi:putative FmdB family regulatory protein
MPVYEFECESCGKHFERTMTITEHDRLKERPVACPECGVPNQAVGLELQLQATEQVLSVLLDRVIGRG